jgi:hypothetical protein
MHFAHPRRVVAINLLLHWTYKLPQLLATFGCTPIESMQPLALQPQILIGNILESIRGPLILFSAISIFSELFSTVTIAESN